ncbi:MAG: SusC/RagA family TonB-linked outer membrane protein, partial [Niabella sp.]
ARGANGVVIVTTKKGTAEKTRISYNPIIGISKLANELEVQSPYEFVLYQDERSRSNKVDSASFVNKYGNDLSIYKNYKAIDWQDEMFGRNAFQNTQSISVTGGNKDTRLNLNYTLNDQDAIMLKSSYRRDLVSLKIDHNLNAKTKIGAIARYSRERIDGAGVSNSEGSSYNLLRNIIRYQPIIVSNAPIDQFDDEYYEENGPNTFALLNPIALNNAKEAIRKNNVLNVTGSLEYKFNQDFSFKSVVGGSFSDQSRNNFNSEKTPEARYLGSSMAMVRTTTGNRKTVNNSNVLTFNKTINKDHKITALIGHELYNVSYEELNIRMRFYPTGITADKALNQISLGTTEDGYPQNNNYENRSLSFFSRVNYGFGNRYLLEASLRSDGSSKFAPSNRWGYFPSASLAWKISNEKFMNNVSQITDLKLRVNYGMAGNNRIADYLYINSFSNGANYYLNNNLVNGYYYIDLANENLKWEKTTSQNIGLDMTLFKRVRFSIDAYSNITDDLLVNVPIPSSSGYKTQLQNVGKTTNRGIEIEIGGKPVSTKELVWNVDFNIAFNRNKVKRISGWQTSVLFQAGVFPGPPSDYILKEGEPLGLMYGYVNDGFYTVEDFDYDAATKVYTLKPGVADASALLGVNQPGGMKFKDLDGNNIIDTDDQQVIGNANPKFSGGLNNQFRYKNFDLSVFVNFVYGNEVYNASKLEFANGYRAYNNMLEIMNDRWRTVNSDGVKVQWIEGSLVKGESPEVLAALNAGAKIWQPGKTPNSSYLPSSWAIEDGSFLRLNNITIGYTMPSNILKKIKSQGLRFYITATNLALWTNYTGYDPEVDTRRATPLTPSVDYSAYPRSRSFLFGLNFTL